MASLHMVATSIEGMISAAVAPVIINGFPVETQIAIGWPSVKTLHDTTRRPARRATIAIYDQKLGHNTTRWAPFPISTVCTPAGVTSSVSNNGSLYGGTVIITLSGAVVAHDAVSLIVECGVFSPAWAVVVEGVAGDSLEALAVKLADAANADTILAGWISAVAVGNTVVLTNLTSSMLTIKSSARNRAYQTVEIGRRTRRYQVVLWAPTEDIRRGIGDPIESALAQAEVDFGLTLSDGSLGRLTNVNDFDLEDASSNDAYRRDFHIDVDYGITTVDVLYSILVPLPQFQLT